MTLKDCWCNLRFEAVCDRCGRAHLMEDEDILPHMLKKRDFYDARLCGVLLDWLRDGGWTVEEDGEKSILICPDCAGEARSDDCSRSEPPSPEETEAGQ